MTLLLPSYDEGYAPEDGLSANPGFLKGMAGAWVAAFGPTGLTLFDVSPGANNPGANTGGPTWNIGDPRIGGHSLLYDGANDYTVADRVPGVFDNMATAACTMWMHMRTSGIEGQSTFNRLFEMRASNANFVEFCGGSDVNYLQWRGRENTAIRKTAFGVIPTNTWLSVVGLWYPGGGLDIYVDGVLGVAAPVGDPTAIAGTQVNIARRADNSADTYTAMEAAAAGIWNRALTFNEIQQLYVDPLAPFRLESTPIAPALAAPAFGGVNQIVGSGIMVA